MTEFRPALVSNYTHAKRPVDVRIYYIVIHATELSYSDTIARFQSANQVSAHVVIRQVDGHRTEMVAPENVAWHAGNWDMNCRSLGIEQEAYIEDPATYTEIMMNALADQIQEWSARYHVPLDRAHLLGHDNVAAPTREKAVEMHHDPGWYFDWENLFQRLGINPATVQPVKVDQGIRITSNYVDLYQQPTLKSKVIGNKTDPSSYRASYGEEFVCIAQQGDWIAIYFSGQKAWLKQSHVAGVQQPILKIGDESVALYGSTQPGAPAIGELLPGEQYVISDQLTGLKSSDAMGRLVTENTTDVFQQIWYNHRIGYVQANQK
ncbi:MAG TPA: hypothetical protein DDW71_02795 [Lactobacillus sp.]|nr:hypothetical protein [Lactobacillus sp.]